MAVRRVEAATGGTVCGPETTLAEEITPPCFYYLDSGNSSSRCRPGAAQTGDFTALNSSTPPTLPSGVGNDMAIVNKKFLYLPQSDSLTIQAFTIGPTPPAEALTTISGSPFRGRSITSDPAGRFLFVGNQTTGSVSIFRSRESTRGRGSSARLTIFRLQSGFRRSGKFLYVGQNFAALPVYAFSIDQEDNGGASGYRKSFQPGCSPGVRTDFTGKFAVGLSRIFADNHLYVFHPSEHRRVDGSRTTLPSPPSLNRRTCALIPAVSLFTPSEWILTALLRPLRVSPLIPPQAP